MASEQPVTSSDTLNGGEESTAQKLRQKHATSPVPVTVQDVPDEEGPTKPAGTDAASWTAPMSAKVAGKQPETAAPKNGLNTHSHDLFPELGAPKAKTVNVAPSWAAKSSSNGKVNGSAPNGVSRSSTPASGVATPMQDAKPVLSIPGRNVESVTLEQQFILPRDKLRRSIPEILKDLNRKSRATIFMTTPNGRLKFDATGPQDVAQQALKDLVQQIGKKTAIKFPIPQSARAHIIGKGGSMVKILQEKSGAKIQVPKAEQAQAPGEDEDEDDDATIDVLVEGNALSAASAQNEILKIVGEKSSQVHAKVRGIPTAFYPFIAGPEHSLAHALQESNGVQVHVPSYRANAHVPSTVAIGSGSRPVFHPAQSHDEHIQLIGDRAAVQKARAEIERRAAQLHDQLEAEQLSIQRSRHQFIGSRGLAVDAFFNETGCAIVLPSDEDDDMVTVIGPNDRVSAAVERAMDLAMGMQMSHIDIGRLHRNAPGGAVAHAGNVTRYLRHRREIERLENQYNTHINTPFSQNEALPWELYSRDGKNAIRAQSEITGIINGHPPSRMQTLPIDPFFHQHLRSDIMPRVKKDHGVRMVIPEASEMDHPVLLVYEGPDPDEGPYQLPHAKPSDAEIRAFQQGLEAAQKYVLDLINNQESLQSTTLDVPSKFHERLRRFIKKEQEARSSDQIPIRVTKTGTNITLRGPASAVESLTNKTKAFLRQEEEDEKERGFTMSFDFPQKFANHLIGKGGSNIKELRERFDVEIFVRDGKVKLKGPRAKAEAARAHILNLGRSLADEVTHVLKIDPKFHRELIGAQAGQINRLQTRYKVLIFFPRSAKSAADDQSSADAASDAGKPRRQQAADEIIIRGPKRGADKARNELYSLHKYLEEHSVTSSVPIQQKQVGSLIGHGGAALDELRQASGARIDIPQNRDTEMVEISIKGTASQVAKAKQLLEEKREVFDDTIVQTVDIDRKHHRALIGPGGSILREIVVTAGGSDDRRSLARTVQFPKQDTDGNAIKVQGRTDVVQKIVKRFQELAAERESQVTETVDVAVEHHRNLIGRGGDVKRQMEARFGVFIEVPRQGDAQTGVKITGLPDKVAQAKEHIAGLVQQQQGETIEIPRSVHHAVSSNGYLFHQLRNNHKVTVDHAGQRAPSKPDTSTRELRGALPLITDDADSVTDAHSWRVVQTAFEDEGTIPWVLKGSPENVAKAKAVVEKALAQASKSDSTGYLVLPDPKMYRHIIGPGGSTVDSIREQTGCRVQVPQANAKDETIEIYGSREGVEKARDLILSTLQKATSKARE